MNLKKISSIIIVCFLILLTSSTATAYIDEDVKISNFQFQENGLVLGYSDIIHMSCDITCPYEIKGFGVRLDAVDSVIHFGFTKNETTDKYEINEPLTEDSLENRKYSVTYIEVYFSVGEDVKRKLFYDADIQKNVFYFSNECKTNGHTFDDGVITKESSTTSEGEKTFTCERCGFEKKEIIPIIEEKNDISDNDTDTKGETTQEKHTISRIEITPKIYKCNGSHISALFSVYDENNNLVPESSYTYGYKNNVKVGDAVVWVKGNTDLYTGELSENFMIIPSDTNIINAKGGKKCVTLLWKKSGGLTQYKVEISTSKSMKNAKSYIFSKNKVKATIKKLKSKKKYYVRIIAIGNPYNSYYSQIQSFKTK